MKSQLASFFSFLELKSDLTSFIFLFLKNNKMKIKLFLPTKKIKHLHFCAHIHSRIGRFRPELQRDSQHPYRPRCDPWFLFFWIFFLFTLVAIAFPSVYTVHHHSKRTLTAVYASFSLLLR